MSDENIIDAPTLQSPKGYDLPAFDPARFAHHLENTDLTEEQQIELLRTLWWIMAAFVDLGFGVDSVQRVLPGLAELATEFSANALEPIKLLPADQFNETAREGVSEKGTHGNLEP